jgi:DNA-binding transcriptional ArsR family regulator
MNPHEEAFVEAFVHADRRERFLAALANPERRAVFRRELHHPRPKFLQAKYIEQIPPSEHHTRFVVRILKRMGASDDCWVFGNHIDGRQMKLEQALDEVIGMGSGTIVSCVPGKLAFFESEDRRMILRQV